MAAWDRGPNDPANPDPIDLDRVTADPSILDNLTPRRLVGLLVRAEWRRMRARNGAKRAELARAAAAIRRAIRRAAMRGLGTD
jgi:hypothetical protein